MSLDPHTGDVLDRVAKANGGFLPRNTIVRAFKKAGAKVSNADGRLGVEHDGQRIPLAGGDTQLGQDTTFGKALKEMAQKLIQANQMP